MSAAGTRSLVFDQRQAANCMRQWRHRPDRATENRPLFLLSRFAPSQCPIKPHLSFLTCPFGFLASLLPRLHNAPMRPQSRLAGSQNCDAIFRHLILGMTLERSCYNCVNHLLCFHKARERKDVPEGNERSESRNHLNTVPMPIACLRANFGISLGLTRTSRR